MRSPSPFLNMGFTFRWSKCGQSSRMVRSCRYATSSMDWSSDATNKPTCKSLQTCTMQKPTDPTTQRRAVPCPGRHATNRKERVEVNTLNRHNTCTSPVPGPNPSCPIISSTSEVFSTLRNDYSKGRPIERQTA